MVYYSSSLGKIRFNRNILYCKFVYYNNASKKKYNLIETFCIVNQSVKHKSAEFAGYLIETFCIVN